MHQNTNHKITKKLILIVGRTGALQSSVALRSSVEQVDAKLRDGGRHSYEKKKL